MNFDQIRQFTPQIREIAQKHGISHIYVFGSTARGENTLHSDIDFLVENHQRATSRVAR